MYSWPLAHTTRWRRSRPTYTFPDPTDPNRFKGLRQAALQTIEEGRAVVIGSISAGVSEMHASTRRFEKYFTDFYLYPEVAVYIMDEVTGS